jgi:VIT1/CCC1 family predicted Fe2+/Mn2+ transporter
VSRRQDIKVITLSLLNRQFEIPDIKDHLRKEGYSEDEITTAFTDIREERREHNKEAVSRKTATRGFVYIIGGVFLLLAFQSGLVYINKTFTTIRAIIAVALIAWGLWVITRPIKDKTEEVE